MEVYEAAHEDECNDTVAELLACRLTERAFSFGGDHRDPRTNEPLRDCHVVIVAPGVIVHRSIMIALFGREWCAEYHSEAELLRKCGPDSRRYMYVRFAGEVGKPYLRSWEPTGEGTAGPPS